MFWNTRVAAERRKCPWQDCQPLLGLMECMKTMNHQHEQNPQPRPARPAWTTRGLVSLLLLLQTVILMVSGVMRYINPRCRDANWMDWRVLALNKDQWASLHAISGLVVVILAVFHLAYNWRPLLGYLRRKTGAVARYGRELAAAGLLSMVLLGLAIADLPPANLLHDLSDRFKDAYAASIERAPWPHTEDFEVERVCRRLGIPIEQALASLEKAGMPARDSSQTLTEIARTHRTSPQRVFNAIQRQIQGVGQQLDTAPSEQRCRRQQGDESDS
ncbi:MAG: DUF4405 domain-containing protein [Phycisphaerales bacterium]|nr:DUF4405 domain-containing protein [Phycisphaerales bacterium]